MKIISREEALAAGLKRYFTGKPCRNGHIAERNTSHKQCLTCKREDYLKHRDDYLRRAKEQAVRDPEGLRVAKRKWRRTEKGKAQSRNWVKNNKKTHTGYTYNWKQRNLDKVYEYTGTRRAAKLLA